MCWSIRYGLFKMSASVCINKKSGRGRDGRRHSCTGLSLWGGALNKRQPISWTKYYSRIYFGRRHQKQSDDCLSAAASSFRTSSVGYLRMKSQPYFLHPVLCDYFKYMLWVHACTCVYVCMCMWPGRKCKKEICRIIYPDVSKNTIKWVSDCK